MMSNSVTVNPNLTPKQKRVLFEKETEAPFTGPYVHEKAQGNYRCAACNFELFASGAKFDSGTGWPSFDEAKRPLKLVKDTSHGMTRTEVLCPNCGGHLGHLFDDGPTKTGKRFCINGCALSLEKKG